jgi:GT2 family glycosyltransferase
VTPVITHVAGAWRPPYDCYDADVVILALDRLEDTVAAIRSALAQTGVSRHVTVLDQGSQPENLIWLAATVAGRDDATLLRSDRNLGVAEGRNQASAFGHGRVIVGLDNDAEFADTDTLARMVGALESEPDLAAIGCRIVQYSSGADDLTSWGYPRALLPRAGDTFLAATFVGAGHAIRRVAWTEAGGYDPALFFCWEEYDFCLRAIANGWRVRYCGDLIIRHKVSSERRVEWSDNRWFHFVRNRLYIERKYGQSWLALIPRMLGYLIKGARNGLGWRTPRAILAAIWMGRRTFVPPLPGAARAYLRRHDAAHRGGLGQRVRAEVLAGHPPL